MKEKHMRKGTHILLRFWSTDRSLIVLLALLFINIFVLQPLSDLGLIHVYFVTSFVFSLILISGVISVARSRFITVLAVVLALALFSALWMVTLVPSVGLASLTDFLAIVFLGMLSVVVLHRVFREGPITMQRIIGAVIVYLLLGLMWAFAYKLVELQRPGSFNSAGLSDVGHAFDPKTRLIYFSIATLTTVGYGDITPVHPIARSLVMLEALIGQLFPVILIARLVSMEIYYRQIQKESLK
jgi:ion channel